MQYRHLAVDHDELDLIEPQIRTDLEQAQEETERRHRGQEPQHRPRAAGLGRWQGIRVGKPFALFDAPVPPACP